MRKFFLIAILPIFCLLVACQDEDDPFLISKNHIGLLTKDVRINELEDLYIDDSIVKNPVNQQYFNEGAEIEIYDKTGKLLLILQPVQQFDTTSTVGNIQIVDPRFKTKKGLGIESTFGDIIQNYSVSRIENTLTSAVVFVDEIGAYISIDKKHLPSEVRFGTDAKIEASQIPNEAKFKYFMIGWN